MQVQTVYNKLCEVNEGANEMYGCALENCMCMCGLECTYMCKSKASAGAYSVCKPDTSMRTRGLNASACANNE